MPARILVVEDNELNSTLVRSVLEARGHTILEAASAGEARERLAAATPDVILLDIQIPGGGGEALLAEIRQWPGLPRVPIIAVTAFAMSGDAERLLALGFDGYISKPIDTRRFPLQVEAYLSGVGAKQVEA